jgi:hypothetical protein
MPNVIKYNISTETRALKKGNFWIGTGDVDKGPTGTTGYWNGITPPAGGYTIYLNKASGGPSIYSAANDTQLISLSNAIAGQTFATAAAALAWFATQTDKIVFNRDYESIVTDGLVLNLDAGFTPSYPTTNTTWYDISSGGNNGELINGPTFDPNNFGSIVFDGSDDFVDIPYSTYWNTNVFGTSTNFTLECWYKPDLFKNWDTLIEKSESSGWYSRSEGAAIWTDSGSIQGVFSSGVDGNPGGSYVVISYPTTTLKWYHIAFTGDGTNLRLYVDGIERATGLVSTRTVAVYNGSVGPRLGRRAFMDGRMALVRFYTRGITAQEITQNYNAQKGRYGIQ